MARSPTSCSRSASSPSTTRAASCRRSGSRLVVPAYAHLAETGRLPLRVLASLRAEALATALAGGLRSGDGPRWRTRRAGARRLAEDASPTDRSGRGRPRCSPTSSPSPTGRSPPELRRGVWNTEPSACASSSTGGGRRDRDADPRHRRCRGAGRARRPRTDRGADPFMPRIEHVQLLDPADRGRFAAGRHRGQRPADPSRERRRPGPPAVGRARRVERLHVGVDRGDRCRPRVRDRRAGRAVRPVARDRAGRLPRGPALAGRDARRSGRTRRSPLERAIRGACLDPAASARRERPGAPDRRPARRHRGHPGGRLDEPVEPGGALRDRPASMVVMDGRVVFEA